MKCREHIRKGYRRCECVTTVCSLTKMYLCRIGLQILRKWTDRTAFINKTYTQKKNGKYDIYIRKEGLSQQYNRQILPKNVTTRKEFWCGSIFRWAEHLTNQSVWFRQVNLPILLETSVLFHNSVHHFKKKLSLNYNRSLNMESPSMWHSFVFWTNVETNKMFIWRY